jgi:hypothetical protein
MPANDSQLVFIVDSTAFGFEAESDIDYVNSADSTPSTFVTDGTNTSLNNPYQVVADTAAGIYFVIDPDFTFINTINGPAPAGGTVREGLIGSPTSPTTVAYTIPSPTLGEVWALAIDTVNHVVYVAEDTLDIPRAWRFGGGPRQSQSRERHGTEISHGRGEDRRKPDRVDAQFGQIRQAPANAGEIAHTVAAFVLKRARVDLIDDAALPPMGHRVGHVSTGSFDRELLRRPQQECAVEGHA